MNPAEHKSAHVGGYCRGLISIFLSFSLYEVPSKMATGLDILGAVAASLELVKIAKSCLSVFNDLRRVDQQSKDQQELHFRLVTQGLKFERWCATLRVQDMIGLLESNPKGWRQTKEFENFEEVLKSQLRFKNEDMARLTLDILRNMKQKFDEAEKIFTKYSEPKPRAIPEPTKSKLNLRWNRLSRRVNGTLSSNQDPSIGDADDAKSRRTQLYSTARWISTDKSTATKLLLSLEKINESLVDLLQSDLQKQIGRRTNLAILDNNDYHTLGLAQSLPEGSDDLKALASMKQWQVRQQSEIREDISSSRASIMLNDEPSNNRVHTYPVQDFKRGTLGIGDSRSLSWLDGQSVIVEWKYYSRDHPFGIEQSMRIASLVILLNRNNLFNKFLALPCKGLVNDNDNSRIGIVFAIGEPSATVAKPLHEFVHSTSTAPPPVGDRFSLAKSLALSLHHLLSVQWLHKSIRSDNIICFQSRSTTNVADHPKRSIADPGETDIVEESVKSASATNSPMTGPPAPLPPFSLLGWDLSRPDHPSELSETLSISTSGFQTKREIIQMYSHPDILSTTASGKHARYRAQYDIYSMGLVLLEIGLWRTLDTIRPRCKDDEDFRRRVQTEYCDKLQAKMGLIYWRAVQRCLNNDFNLEKEPFANEEDFSLQVAFEKHVICELERCFA